MDHPFKVGQVWKTGPTCNYFYQSSTFTIIDANEDNIYYLYPKDHIAWAGLSERNTWSKYIKYCIEII